MAAVAPAKVLRRRSHSVIDSAAAFAALDQFDTRPSARPYLAPVRFPGVFSSRVDTIEVMLMPGFRSAPLS
jgi:hypothetical protein